MPKHNLDQYNFYFQDEWKVRPNLTLNYGARWEYYPPGNTSPIENVFVAATPIVGTPLPATPVVNAPGAVSFVRAKHWYEGSFAGAIGPRFGLAWSPDYKSGPMHLLFGDSGTSVVRLGYGLAFDTISSFQITAAAGRVPGLEQSCTTSFSTSANAFTSITPGCVFTNDLNKTVAGGFPTQLAAPTVKPSSLFTRRNNCAPTRRRSGVRSNMHLPTVHQWNLAQRELDEPGIEASYTVAAANDCSLTMPVRSIPIQSCRRSIMQQNRAKGCAPTGTGCPAGVTGVTPPLLTQLQTQGGVSATAATNFLTSTTTINNLDFNSVGNLALRIEDNTLGLKLRPNQQFAIITKLDNSGDSNYHAAQFVLRRRFDKGLGLSVAYTFGKSIDNQSVDPVGASSGGGLSNTNSRTPTDIRNFRDERGRSDFDRTHVLAAATVWELPFGRGRQYFRTPVVW
jgi:hypothetical protein